MLPTPEVSLLLKYTPQNENRKIPVYFESGRDAFAISYLEMWALAREGMIRGRWTASGYLRSVVLLCPVFQARRVLRGANAPTLAGGVISKKHQAKGSKKWVQRADMSKTGHAGMSRVVWA